MTQNLLLLTAFPVLQVCRVHSLRNALQLQVSLVCLDTTAPLVPFIQISTHAPLESTRTTSQLLQLLNAQHVLLAMLAPLEQIRSQT